MGCETKLDDINNFFLVLQKIKKGYIHRKSIGGYETKSDDIKRFILVFV